MQGYNLALHFPGGHLWHQLVSYQLDQPGVWLHWSRFVKFIHSHHVMHVISFLWLHWSWFEKFTVTILYVISFLCMKFWMWALYKMSSSYCHSHHHHHPHHQHHHQQEGVSPTTTHLYLSHSGPLIHLLKTNLKKWKRKKQDVGRTTTSRQNKFEKMQKKKTGCWPYYYITFFICHVAAMSSTCYNPLLYGWFNNAFRFFLHISAFNAKLQKTQIKTFFDEFINDEYENKSYL